MTLEEDLQAIKNAEMKAEERLKAAEKKSQEIKSETKAAAKKEEDKLLSETREEMAEVESALVKKAQVEGEEIIKDSQATVERLKSSAQSNKKAASDYLIKEILES